MVPTYSPHECSHCGIDPVRLVSLSEDEREKIATFHGCDPEDVEKFRCDGCGDTWTGGAT